MGRAEQKAYEGRGRRLWDIFLHSECRWVCQAGSKMEKRCLDASHVISAVTHTL